MLIEFSVENFLSFKERATLSMVAAKDDSLPQNVITEAQGTNLNLLKSAAIYGANASGKSNLAKALFFMKLFVENSSKQGQEGLHNGVIPFKLDTAMQEQPSIFEIVFLREGIRYKYGFSADSKRIHKEWLWSYIKRKGRLLFERRQAIENAPPIFNFSPYWKGERKRLAKLTRPNALFLSIAAQFNHPLAGDVFKWFSWDLWNISYFPRFGWEHPFTCDYSYSKLGKKEEILRFLKQADLGIDDFSIQKIPIRDSKEFSSSTDEVKQRTVRDLPSFPDPYQHYVTTVHRGKNRDGKALNIPLGLDEESDGTQKLFSLSGPWQQTLEVGRVLLADELDVRLHPLLTKWLIQSFHDEKINPHGAQLIFTTHDSSFLDNNLLRRDQIWFTEKNEAGATNLYSLWDFKEGKPRKAENLARGYLAGRYGAIPILEDLANGR